MKCLLIKTSSLGDIIHTLPAITDAAQYFPDISFDWVVEENFAEIPKLHPNINRVIPFALRRWRKSPFNAKNRQEMMTFFKALRLEQYDLVIDAQGLLKSAWLTLLAKGPSYGLDWSSARESAASLFYRHKVSVNFHQHAIVRMRELMAKVLGYAVPAGPAQGLDRYRFAKPDEAPEKYLIFLHGTTWETKLWPVVYWQQLAKIATDAGWQILLPWSNDQEKQTALAIKQNLDAVTILPKQGLVSMTAWIAHANAIVAVDTGLGHLAAALGVPALSLYGPTNPDFTGTMGLNQHHLSAQFPCAPCLSKICTYKGPSEVQPACFGTIPPDKVWQSLQLILSNEKN